jgi:glycosyltransferase involved in cell wall biosynthesis
MNWVFIDFIRWDYDIATPRERPLGGSQSALCYLAAALARRGQRVTTLTGTTKQREIDGVRCISYESFPADIFARPDTLSIVLNGPAEAIQAVRQVVPRERPVFLWTQHAHDQPAMKGLRNSACVEQWDRIVCISEWQKRMFHQELGVPLDRIDIQRNAIGPLFEHMFRDVDHLSKAKAGKQRLTYTSTPFRGLDLLLACFPAIRRKHATCVLDVFSSMQVYGQLSTEDEYQTLYDQCRATEGIHYRGSVSQTELAKQLEGATMLAYPNTFAETSCIAAMEALAAGLLVVSSDLGALPETCGPWAKLIPPAAGGRSKEQFAIDFARTVDGALQEMNADPSSFYRKRFAQSQAINDSCTWDIRAAEWEAAAGRWLKGR